MPHPNDLPIGSPGSPPGGAASAPDAAGLAWMARRGVAPQWRGFLAALLDTLDGGLEPAARDELLQAIGARLAEATPLAPCATLAELEARANQALAAMDWGYVAYSLDAGTRQLTLRHLAAPLVATRRDAQGQWVAPVLEGLHGGWLAAQAEPGVRPRLRRVAAEPGSVTLQSC